MTPIVVVAAMDFMVRDVATGALMVDLPGGVLLRHQLTAHTESPGDGIIDRLVTDATGIVEAERIELEHACLSCAVREDLVPTLQRLIDSGRWEVVVLALPLTASPSPVVLELESAIEAEELDARMAGVLSVVDPSRLTDDLFGDDLLAERDSALGPGDRRSVGEALTAQLEYADVVCCLGPPAEQAAGILDHLVAPTATWFPSLDELSANHLVDLSHDSVVARDRVDPVNVPTSRADPSDQVWTLELVSHRPMHPQRLMDQLELLAVGKLRGRGCFWLPTRPGQVCAWDGAGGQLAVGPGGWWGRRIPITRLLITGIDTHERDRVQRAFADVLLTDFELRRISEWVGRDDPFAPWLGATNRRGAS
ncbi:cobalamin biosynthesis protein CobW [Naumannella sp. ID2617S]|nr:cobalamin biosynthesis protein CobW [Naumannella sp. ID2617S]